jgi:cold shock CspA family protein
MKGKIYRGQVVLWDDIRGFGFIQTAEVLLFGEEKIFVHRSNCIDAIHLGAHCEFEVGDPYKIGRKPQAVRVTIRVNAAGLDALARGIPEDAPINAMVSQIGASSQGGV